MLPVIFMSNLSSCSSEQTPFHVGPTHLAVMEGRESTYYIPHVADEAHSKMHKR